MSLIEYELASDDNAKQWIYPLMLTKWEHGVPHTSEVVVQNPFRTWMISTGLCQL